MDKILWLSLLFDFYGELLTDKQKAVFTMYHEDDLSLSEIGEELGISRQAVNDQLKRTESLLIGYEDKLGLVARFELRRKEIASIKELAGDIENKYSEGDGARAAARKIISIADNIL